MNTPSPKTTMVLAASLFVGAYVPLAFGQSGSVFIPKETLLRTISSTPVRLHRAYTVQERRDFVKAMEIYREYVRQGMKDLIRPAVDDRESIDLYLENPLEPQRDFTERPQLEPAAPKGYVRPVQEFFSEKELNAEQRATLQRAVKIGRCWNFPQFPESFDELCKKLIKGTKEIRTIGVQSDLQTIQQNRMRENAAVVSKYKRVIERSRILKGTRGPATTKTYVQ